VLEKNTCECMKEEVDGRVSLVARQGSRAVIL